MAFTISSSLSKISGLIRMGRFINPTIVSKNCYSRGVPMGSLLQKEGLAARSKFGLLSEPLGAKPLSVDKRCYGDKAVQRIRSYTFSDGVHFSVEPLEDCPIVPVIPIRTTSLMPVFLTIFQVTDKRLREVIKRNMDEGEPCVGFFLVKDDKNVTKIVNSVDDLHPVGTLARVYRVFEDEENFKIYVVGDRRISINNLRKENLNGSNIAGNDVLIADINNIQHEEFSDNETKELVAKIMNVISDICKLDHEHGCFIQNDLKFDKVFFESHANLCDYCAAIAEPSVGPKELQKVLEETNIPKRLSLSLELLKKDYESRLKPENRERSHLRHLSVQH